MKKLSAILLVSATALLSAFGLAACGDQNGNPTGTAADYTVTESEWTEAVSLRWKNLTYTVVAGDANSQFSITLQMLANGSIHQTCENIGWGECYFMVNGDNTVSSYSHHTDTGDTWQYEPARYTNLQSYESGNYGDDAGFLAQALPSYTEYSSSYTYDETKHCYTRTMPVVGMPAPVDCQVEISFENKKLTKLVVSSTEDETAGVTTVTFYDYGSTAFTPPEHAFNVTEWEYDGAEHWHPCIAEGCKDKSGTKPHEYADGTCECGARQ